MEVKTNHEYHAMQHQIAAAAAEVAQHEEKILVSMLAADDETAAIKKAEAALKAAQAKVNTDRSALERDVQAQGVVAAECAAARAGIVSAIESKGFLETFERIAKVRGTAVARAVDERCTVCQVRLRPAVFVNVLKNDQIVQCDSCNRILFFMPPKPADAPGQVPTAGPA